MTFSTKYIHHEKCDEHPLIFIAIQLQQAIKCNRNAFLFDKHGIILPLAMIDNTIAHPVTKVSQNLKSWFI